MSNATLLKRVAPAITAVGVAVLRRLHGWRKATHSKQTLIVRPGGMGDLIQCTIALESLGLDPRTFTWLIERRSAPWAGTLGLDVIFYDDSLVTTFARIRSRFRLVIDTEQRYGMATLLAERALAKSGRLIGLNTNRGRALFDETISYDAFDMPEALAFRHLFAVALLHEDQDDSLDAIARPRRTASDGSIVVALGGVHDPTRHLDAQTWDDWIARVLADGGISAATTGPLHLVYGPGERELGAALLRLRPDRYADRSGSFTSVVHNIEVASRVITIDGGPTHVASYFGVPSDVLFTAGRTSKWRPLAAGSTVYVRLDVPGRPFTVFGQVSDSPAVALTREGLPGSLTRVPSGATADPHP